MNNGFILLHRKIIKEWEWYSNTNDRLVFIHCLLSANWEDGWFEGKKIPRGSFATSYKNLAREVGISVQSLRTSLEHLKSTHNITHETNKQFSIITIENYDKYQTINTSSNKRPTNDQQTTNNNINNNNEEQIRIKNNKYIVEIIDYLNERTGQHYKYNNKNTVSHIEERLNEGFNVDDFKIVIDKMCVEWMNTDMQKYLRPDTLFRPSKFESYLNREVKPTTKNISLSTKDIESIFG